MCDSNFIEMKRGGLLYVPYCNRAEYAEPEVVVTKNPEYIFPKGATQIPIFEPVVSKDGIALGQLFRGFAT